MNTFTKFGKKIISWLDDWFVYAVTLIAVMFSSQLDSLKTSGTVDLSGLSVGVFALSALVALGITAYSESLKKDKDGNVGKSREGRRQHFWKRVGTGIAFGIMWPQILELFIK